MIDQHSPRKNRPRGWNDWTLPTGWPLFSLLETAAIMPSLIGVNTALAVKGYSGNGVHSA